MSEINVVQIQAVKDMHRRRVRLSTETIDYLIEQAERVQQLEKAVEQKPVTVQTKHFVYGGPDESVSYGLLKEIAQLRETLEQSK